MWRSAGSSSRISDVAERPSSQPTCRIAITSRTPGSTTQSRISSADWATISCRLPRARLCNTTRARGSSLAALFAVAVPRGDYGRPRPPDFAQPGTRGLGSSCRLSRTLPARKMRGCTRFGGRSVSPSCCRDCDTRERGGSASGETATAEAKAVTHGDRPCRLPNSSESRASSFSISPRYLTITSQNFGLFYYSSHTDAGLGAIRGCDLRR
jgi:hypothetical protein